MRPPFLPMPLALAVLAAIAPACASADARRSALEEGALPPVAPVANFSILAPGIAGSAQPGNAAFGPMREAGYVAVLNLRTPAENEGRGEAEAVAAAGLVYAELPVSASELTLADGVRFGEALRALPSGPVLVHCGSGNRVGAVWALWRAVEEGASADWAQTEARRAGVTSDNLAARVRDQVARAENSGF